MRYAGYVGDSEDSVLQANARFATTRWSVVSEAQRRGRPETKARDASVDDALASLCQTYWPAVYAFLRRQGHRPEGARDLTQGFFAKLLEKDWIERADVDRGSFRAFLVTLVRRYVASEFQRETSLRRGGDAKLISISGEDQRGWLEPATHATPEKAFDSAWIQAMLAQVLQELRQEYASAGQMERFEVLEPYLVAGESPPPFPALAATLGLAESSCRVAVFRARRRYRELLRGEIAGTLGEACGVDVELEALISIDSET